MTDVQKPFIELRDVHKSFGAFPVLKGVSLAVKDGGVVCIIGPSGSGKSTILRCINGLTPINGGSIRVGDFQVETLRSDRDFIPLRHQVAMVFQQYNLFPHRTVLQNLTMAPVQVLGWPDVRGLLAPDLLATVGRDTQALLASVPRLHAGTVPPATPSEPPNPGECPARLPVPSPLPPRRAGLPRRQPAAAGEGPRLSAGQCPESVKAIVAAKWRRILPFVDKLQGAGQKTEQNQRVAATNWCGKIATFVGRPRRASTL